MNTAEIDKLARDYINAIKTGNLGKSARLQDELDAAGQAEQARLTAPNALGNAALWYARRGVAVFPCRPRDKRPATTHGLKDATTDLDTIRRWWASEPRYNIGAPTGRLFDVIDIDGREGVLSVYAPDPDTGEVREMPPEIGHALTPREAGHHVFIAPTGRGNTTRMLPGVDYRGAGGYVLLPPSVGDNGARYVWTRPLQFKAAA